VFFFFNISISNFFGFGTGYGAVWVTQLSHRISFFRERQVVVVSEEL